MGNPHFMTQYLGKPWEQNGRGPDTFDCYGLVWWVYRKHLGIELPNHNVAHLEDHLDKAAQFIAEGMKSGDWFKLEVPREGCIVGMSRSRRIHHVGIFFTEAGGLIYHVENKTPVHALPLSRARSTFPNIAYYSWQR